jgi:hypothetical protein
MARVLLFVLAAAVVAVTAPLGTDYPADAGPVMHALLGLDVRGALAGEPMMGQLSLWLRLPAAGLAQLFGGGELAIYRAGALMCLLAPAVLAAWITGTGARAMRRPADFTPLGPVPVDRRAGETGASLALLVGIVLVANPVVVRALELGHPEEPLGAALCAAAVLFAARGRTVAAGVTLGLALATKQWALLAIGPVVLAAPGDLRRLLAVAAGVAAAWTLPALLIDPHAFFSALQRPATGLHELRPGNVWSLVLGPSAHVDLGGGASAPVTFVPGWLRATAHPGVAVLGVLVPALWWRRRRGRRADDALALLALILLLRCALDPWNHEYYHLPFLTALAAWEVVAVRRLPLVAAVSSALLWVVFARTGGSMLGDAVYVAWAVALAGVLGRPLWRPRPVRRGRAARVTTV